LDDGVKKLAERELQRWSNEWLAARRPGEIKPFWLTELLLALEEKLEGMNHAAETRQKPQNGEPEHKGAAHR
jgi:hypothetical protein